MNKIKKQRKTTDAIALSDRIPFTVEYVPISALASSTVQKADAGVLTLDGPVEMESHWEHYSGDLPEVINKLQSIENYSALKFISIRLVFGGHQGERKFRHQVSIPLFHYNAAYPETNVNADKFDFLVPKSK
jgi:hypothetical protein